LSNGHGVRSSRSGTELGTTARSNASGVHFASMLALATTVTPRRAHAGLKTRVRASTSLRATRVGRIRAQLGKRTQEISMRGRRVATGSRKYLSPEPMLQKPDFVKLAASEAMSLPTYSYAANNPLTYVDPTGKYYWAKACSSPTGGRNGDGWEFLDYDTVDVCKDCKQASAAAIACRIGNQIRDRQVDCKCLFELAKEVCAEMHDFYDKNGVCDRRNPLRKIPSKRPQEELACGGDGTSQ
jgi:hypothetical protein